MRLWRLKRDERGAAAVEFALVFPVLILVFLLIIDFARAYYTLNTLAAAARLGARVGSSRDLDLTCVPKVCDTDAAAIRAAADTLIARAALPLPDNSRFFIMFDGQTVSVEIHSYQYTPLTPIAGFLGKSAFAMDRTAVFRWERAP